VHFHLWLIRNAFYYRLEALLFCIYFRSSCTSIALDLCYLFTLVCNSASKLGYKFMVAWLVDIGKNNFGPCELSELVYLLFDRSLTSFGKYIEGCVSVGLVVPVIYSVFIL